MADQETRERNLDRACMLAQAGYITADDIISKAKEFDGYVNEDADAQ